MGAPGWIGHPMEVLAGLVAQVPPPELPPVDDTFQGPSIDWFALSPVLVLVVGALVLLVTSALSRERYRPGIPALFTIVCAGAVVVLGAFLWDDVREEGPHLIVADAVAIDGFAVFFMILIGASIVITSLLADDYLRRERLPAPEAHALLMLAGAGGIIMASANDLIVLFLGLEVLSIGLYVMTGLHLRRGESQEAAIKYFVLGAFSSAFFLYGIALVYGATGTTNIFEIATFLSSNVLSDQGLLLAGMALLLVGFGFKIAAVPFQLWTPDVYQGAPTPISAYLASVSKAASFAGLLRVFFSGFGLFQQDWTPAIWGLAVLTIVVGSVFAIVQTDVKRILAYSSVSHAGYVLVGMEAGTERGVAGALFYLLAYAFMVLGSFAVVTLVGRAGDARHHLDDYKGLARSRPALALAFTIFLLAQAGMPLTSGFLAKFYVISAAVDAESYALALIAMIAAVVAAFLYLRIIVAMYLTEPEGEPPVVPIPFGAGLAVAATLVFTLVVGFVPDLVVEFARDATLLVS